jgi:predicted Zn finger-like uncharacterized protein
MRLVCPNCEAKYEVPDDAVPDTGRDVQCTNCGHSWFQMRARAGGSPFVAPASTEPAVPAAEPAVEPVVPASEAEKPATTAPVEEPDVIEPEGVREAFGDTAAEPASSDSAPLDGVSVALPEGDAVPESAKVATTSQYAAEPMADSAPEPAVDAVARSFASDEVDPVPEPRSATELPADADVLMPADDASADMVASDVTNEAISGPASAVASEVATDDIPGPAPDYAVDDSVLAILREEAEREANARRAEALESQTDLGIDAAMPPKGAAVAEADAKPAARRDLLPDVEEINSTLRPSEMQDDTDAPDFVSPPPEAPRGFRSGFLSLMTFAILAAALYLVAPRLAVMVPALAVPLEGYVSIVDSLRLGLDGMMRSATVAISDG